MSHRLEAHNCPSCDKTIDACSDLDGDEKPSPGDLCVCFYCGLLLKFGEGMKLVPLPYEEFTALPESDRAQLIHVVQLVAERLR